MKPRMSRHNRKGRQRLEVEQTRVLSHPLRLRLLEMHTREPRRSFSVEALASALAQTREYRDVTAAMVSYHLSRLRDAQLLPES